MTPSNCESLRVPSFQTTRARPVAALTLTLRTPGRCCRDRVTNQLQAAQVMPSMVSTMERPSLSGRLRLW